MNELRHFSSGAASAAAEINQQETEMGRAITSQHGINTAQEYYVYSRIDRTNPTGDKSA